MKVKLLGYYSGEFKDKSTGRLVKYLKLYVSYETTNVVGVKVEELKCLPDLLEQVKCTKLGSSCMLFFDKYQRVTSLELEV